MNWLTTKEIIFNIIKKVAGYIVFVLACAVFTIVFVALA